jgi:hypothetical protein
MNVINNIMTNYKNLYTHINMVITNFLFKIIVDFTVEWILVLVI